MKDLWDSVLKRLSGELSETTINTWFDEVTVVTMEDSAFVLHCSNTFKKNTIEARFLPHIKAALKDYYDKNGIAYDPELFPGESCAHCEH